MGESSTGLHPFSSSPRAMQFTRSSLAFRALDPRVLAHVALLCTLPTASAQSLVSTHAKILATSGDAAPGLGGGETLNGGGTFDNPVVDDGQGLFFRARLVGGAVTNQTNRAYFYGTDSSDLSLVLQSGAPEPSGTIPGATLNSSSSSGIGSAVRISGNGTMMFATRLDDGGATIDFSNDSAYYVGTPGNFQLLAREGDPAPGTAGATYDSSFSSLSQQLTSLNDSGQALFKSTLTGGDVTGPENDEAWFFGTPGAVSVLAREGDLGPGGEVVERVSPGFFAQMTPAGVVLHDVGYEVGTGVPAVHEGIDRALWAHVPGQGVFEVLREGDPTPIPGTTHDNGIDTWAINTGASSLNAQGQILIRSDLGGPVTAETDSALFIVAIGVQTLVVREGDPVPGLPGMTFTSFNNTSLNLSDTGVVAFEAGFIGDGVTEFTDTGIWAGLPGSLELILRQGDVAPGTGGKTWGNANGQLLMMNHAGQLIFNISLMEGETSTSSRWFWDPVDGLRPIYIGGDTLEVSPGSVANVNSVSSTQFANGAGRPLSFADDGTSSHKIQHSFGEAVVSITDDHLVANPGSISIAAGGSASLDLSAGSNRAGLVYFVLGSASGTSPGLPLDGNLLPLNVDSFFLTSINFANVAPFGNTFGVLGELGEASASFDLPAGLSLTPVSLDFAALAIDIAGVPTVEFTSNAASLQLTP